MSTYMISSLEQAKLLTDPFKLKLLERFADEPITTKQVADVMGEKAPRLYRHVDALVDAGLLELIKERPKRGTVERYYKTIASRFELDPEIFSSADSETDEVANMVRSTLRQTESELLRLHRASEDSLPDFLQAPLVLRMTIDANPEQISRLRQKLNDFVAECEALAESKDDSEDSFTYSGFLAFYPRIE
jgi:DNA-binding transcriptional ArsR family regulator